MAYSPSTLPPPTATRPSAPRALCGSKGLSPSAAIGRIGRDARRTGSRLPVAADNVDFVRDCHLTRHKNPLRLCALAGAQQLRHCPL